MLWLMFQNLKIGIKVFFNNPIIAYLMFANVVRFFVSKQESRMNCQGYSGGLTQCFRRDQFHKSMVYFSKRIKNRKKKRNDIMDVLQVSASNNIGTYLRCQKN